METLELSKKVFERYETHTTRIYYYMGILSMYAFAQTGYYSKDDKVIQKCIDVLDDYPDHPMFNLENYRIGGVATAWMVYKGLWDDKKETVRKYAEMSLDAPVTEKEGIICRPNDPDRNKIWIDLAYGITPFMLYAGLTFNDERYIDFGAEQCFKMYEFFLDKTNGLLHQSRGYMMDKTMVSPDHWSRGNGWCFLALASLVENLPKDSKHRPKAEAYFRDLASALLKYQNAKGVWRQEIPCEYSWDESSGTALFLYGYGVGLRLGILDKDIYWEPYKKGVEAFIKLFITPDFATLMSCEGCLCPGEGPDKGTVKAFLTDKWPRTDEPHSYGTFMLALVEAHLNGITDVTI